MAGDSSKTNSQRGRRRVAAETITPKRALDGSAFIRCEACNKDVPAALIDMHSCSLDQAQVVQRAAEVKKPAERKRTTSSDPKKRRGKKEKKSEDTSAPKHPPAAFFLFMDDFRKIFKEAHPDSKRVYTVVKEGAEKWKSMTDEEKKPYVDRAAELKAEYEKEMVKLDEDNEEETCRAILFPLIVLLPFPLISFVIITAFLLVSSFIWMKKKKEASEKKKSKEKKISC